MEDKSPARGQNVEAYTFNELLAYPREELNELDRQRLAVTSPTAVARMLERIPVDDRRTVLRKYSEEFASEILSEMNPEDSAEVLGAMRESRAVQIIEEFDPDDAADIVAELDDDDRTRLLDKVDPETAHTVQTLLAYDSDTAGGIMTPEFASVYPEMDADQAINHLREHYRETEDLYYIYVVDKENHLQGVVSIRDLILAQSTHKIGEFMNIQVKGVCSPQMDREQVALLIAEHNLVSLPVVGANNDLLGIVTVDDVIDIMQDEATEDIQKLVGAGYDESIHDKISYSLGKRHPWLQVNLLTAFMAAGIIFLFQNQIKQLTLLAVFMPVIASLGGNAGTQTLAVAIRSMALGEVSSDDQLKLCLRESLKGLINGTVVGIIAAFPVYFVTHSLGIALITIIALILNMGLACLLGALIPLLLRKINLDPAQSSSIFLTAVSDVAGFFIFLSLGTWLLL